MSIVTQGYGCQGAVSTQGYGAAVFEALVTLVVGLTTSLKKGILGATGKKSEIQATLKKSSLTTTKVE